MALPTLYDAMIRQVADRYRVDPRLVKAVVAHESKFNPAAVRGEPQNNDASVGLMQVTLSTARTYRPSITPTELSDPATNLDLGTHYLADLLRRAGGDWWRAVSAFNGGWRPDLGLGTVLVAPKTICLEWKATAPTSGRSIARDCARPYAAQAGEFGNQPYVAAVAKLVNQVSQEWNNLPPSTVTGGGAKLGMVVGVLAILAGLAWAFKGGKS